MAYHLSILSSLSAHIMFLLLAISSSSSSSSSSFPSSYSTPFIILHGLGMQCNDEGSIFYQTTLSRMSGTEGSCVEIGLGAYDSWTMNLDQQVEIACAKIRDMPQLQHGYNLVGLSQGNIIGRGVIELCENLPPVKNFISIGGPNAGVSSLPACTNGPWCAGIEAISGMGVYSDYVQATLAPSGYVRLADDIPGYLDGCKFLPRINNEIPNVNNTLHKQRFTSLQNLILIMCESDGVVKPPLSSWFGYYPDGDFSQVLPPEQTILYKDDLFGLRTLDEAGKVKFIKVPGTHLAITIPELQEFVVPYLV
ncbi:unnamed protein product [Cuscuta epithymum]|uniref:Palmitoyl-protein thioesterase 1 n=1 Tax=Cuscuta epithymum TaxID=186058 RepID=A0AAV0GEB8_9ASTE|nr:unnamed protein product [Cuscuta epithymum]